MFNAAEEKIKELEYRIIKLEENQGFLLATHKSYEENKGWWVNNWWRVTAVALPLLFILGEISIFIRKVV